MTVIHIWQVRKGKQERSDLSQLSAESGEPKRRPSVPCAYCVPPDGVCPSLLSGLRLTTTTTWHQWQVLLSSFHRRGN